jgi:hypothetical protein
MAEEIQQAGTEEVLVKEEVFVYSKGLFPDRV